MSRTRRTPPKAGAQSAPPALPTITRARASELLKQRAQELFHEARTQREDRIHQFEGEFGRADRIDHTLLSDLQALQVRFAAIAARQHRYGGESEPRVSKYTKQLGDIIGDLSAHLATERARELFAPVDEREYIGSGATIGRKGLDESILAGYRIVDDAFGETTHASPTAIEGDSEVCLHVDLEQCEDDQDRVVCADCGEEFTRESKEVRA